MIKKITKKEYIAAYIKGFKIKNKKTRDAFIDKLSLMVVNRHKGDTEKALRWLYEAHASLEKLND